MLFEFLNLVLIQKKEITFEFKFGILFKSIDQSQFGPSGLLAQLAC
jgi:hypothetical protein